MSERALTKGEFRVGISFNPSSNPLVDDIKRKAADLIDLVETLAHGDQPVQQFSHEEAVSMEKRRCIALAQTAIEDACMWAVKAATKG